MFELIMKYIYENYTLTLTDVEDVEASFDPYSGLSNLDIYTLFREYMGKLGVSKLFDRMMTSSTERDPPMKFNRLSYPELYDITIKCADNREIKAHRCVLSSRLEYFNLMFNSSWSESTKDIIHLTTVPYEYIEPMINFLYHNDANLIRKQQYTDTFLYRLMEICDQFFVTRLKNIIELIIIEKMNARKCVDMYEFAIIFNCSLLESAALDYICQNMGRLIENHCLDHMQNENLAKVSSYYRKIFQLSDFDLTVTTMMLTMDEATTIDIDTECLSDEAILSFVDDFEIDLFQKNDISPGKITKSKRPERLSSERRNYEKEAIHLVRNLSIETPTQSTNVKKSEDIIVAEAHELSKEIKNESEKWMKVADKKDFKKKIVLAGLKANEVLQHEQQVQEQFIVLKSHTQKLTSDQNDVEKTTVSLGDQSVSEKCGTTFNLGDFTPQKQSAKLSQKQRRRQLSQSENSPNTFANDNLQSSPSKTSWNALTTTPSPSTEQTNAWKTINSSPKPIGILAKSKTQPINIAASTSKSNVDNHSGASFSDSFFSPSPTKSNIYQFNESIDSDKSFTKILEDERKQKEYYNKMKSKSLLLTQIEETAISELKKFYNVDNVFDESIEIERKSSNINASVNFANWKHD